MGMRQRTTIGPMITARPIDPEFDIYASGLYEDLEDYLVTPAEGYEPTEDQHIFMSNLVEGIDVYGVDFSFTELDADKIDCALKEFKEKHAAGIELLEPHYKSISVVYGLVVDWC